MKFGIIFPQTEIGVDPAVIRDFAQRSEDLGYDYMLTFDHVLGANPDRPGGWSGPYDHNDVFHEPFVLYSYLAGLTKRIEFATGVIILPQRQTVLLAKQAAALDVLSSGRVRLGVGVGWNKVEYEALNEDFRTRGRRQAEQVEVLRLLWTQRLVTYQGEFHSIPDAGLYPLPIQQPIPIWFGGDSDAALRRMAKLGDGWITHSYPVEQLAEMLGTVRGYLEEEGRDPATFGIDYHIRLQDKTVDQLAAEIEPLRQQGVSHICIYTMNTGLTGSDHIGAIERFAQAADLVN